MSKHTETKAREYLTNGKIRVVSHSNTEATIRVFGSEEYEVRYKGGTWWCNCPARVECAHLVAARQISDLASDKPKVFEPDPDIQSLLNEVMGD